jgi:Uncharacterized conserved protein (DUF2358)
MRSTILVICCVTTGAWNTLPMQPYVNSLPLMQELRELPLTLAMGTVSSPVSPLEVWCLDKLEMLYCRALSLKCPFFRRRATDFMDVVDTASRFLVVQHIAMDLPLGIRAGKRFIKHTNLDVKVIFNSILRDWRLDTDKGYYVTGRLNTTIYHDQCIFEGPDPDMPVLGLQKYLNAASQLFDYSSSRAELVSLRIENSKLLVAEWKMEAVLRVPWHPVLREWRGKTYYHLDDSNLINRHEEEWDMSVFEAFLMMITPSSGEQIWNQKFLF